MRDAILAAIYAAIDQVNRQNPGKKPVGKSLGTSLFGSTSDLDSLGLINLVVAVEENIEKSQGAQITLVDDRALSAPVSPFATVESLANYIEQLLVERKNG
jgi:acyl carrier protein